MSSNPWISGAVPFGKYLADARAKARAEAEPLRFDPPTFDYLGPATPETRAEVKSARRAEQRKATKELVTAYPVMALVAAAFALGTLVGNVTDSDFRDVRIPVPSPSGERAEPEGGQ